jgi:hypothetical protein
LINKAYGYLQFYPDLNDRLDEYLWQHIAGITRLKQFISPIEGISDFSEDNLDDPQNSKKLIDPEVLDISKWEEEQAKRQRLIQ